MGITRDSSLSACCRLSPFGRLLVRIAQALPTIRQKRMQRPAGKGMSRLIDRRRNMYFDHLIPQGVPVMKRWTIVCLWVMIAYGSSGALTWADDLYQPTWQRGAANTTYQDWTFTTDANPWRRTWVSSTPMGRQRQRLAAEVIGINFSTTTLVYGSSIPALFWTYLFPTLRLMRCGTRTCIRRLHGSRTSQRGTGRHGERRCIGTCLYRPSGKWWLVPISL